MDDTGYVIYSNTGSSGEKFKFNKSTGGRGVNSINVKHNNNRTQLTTFGRVPYVYYAGSTDFVEFNLKTVFHYDYDTGETARAQVDRFKSLIDNRETLVVENSQGQGFLCDVNIVGENAPQLYTDRDFDYIEIEVKCVQIDY